MICREFIRKVEELPLSELDRATEVELLAHERECSDCAERLQHRRALAGALKVLRKGTATWEAPWKVEQNVLRAFRQSAASIPAAEPRPVAHAFPFRLSRVFQLGAYAAAAAALAISLGLGVWYLQQHKSGENRAQQQKTSTQPMEASSQPGKTARIPAAARSARTTRHPANTAAAATTRSSSSIAVLARAQQAQGYTPVMLCDPLSCSGDEQVVRMELPVSDGSQESQMADVIIGDDGLVRAIRIVQQ